MAEVEGTGTRKKLINNLCKVDLPVLGDLGMKPLPPTATEAFTGSLRASLRKSGDHLDYQSVSGGLGAPETAK